jgi:hypothetical protein
MIGRELLHSASFWSFLLTIDKGKRPAGAIPGARAGCLRQRWYGVARHRSRGDGRTHGTRVLARLTS